MHRVSSRLAAAIVVLIAVDGVCIAWGPAGTTASGSAAGAGPDLCEPAPATTKSTNPDGAKLPTLKPYVDPLPLPRKAMPIATSKGPGGGPVEHYRIVMKGSSTQLHSGIPAPTPIYGYDGTFPGPTFDVHKDTNVVVEWVNDIEPEPDPNQPHILRGKWVAPTADTPFPQDWPGSGPSAQDESAAPAPIWTVVHLHGGTTPPGSDGWPDDAFPRHQSVFYSYPGEPRATLLWYHDHADMITRLNVAAGLAGMYLVRDGIEEKLGLPKLRYDQDGVPTGMQRELPLLIQDRSLELDQNNQFNGRMLHKLAGDGAEFYGPYTLVNGKIWPYVEVEPRQVRLRLLNGSNGRFYRLRLKDDQGNYRTDDFRQIGTDSGRLDHPVAIPANGLTLSPAERADVILDLRKYAGKSVSLVNDYPMPMLPVDPTADNVPDAPKYEEVLQFRVAARSSMPDDLDLAKAFRGIAPHPRPRPADATRKRKLYLIEDPPGTLTINTRLFHDRVEEVVHRNDIEIWEIVNTTEDFHPFHIHLVDFELFERQQFDYDAGYDKDKWVASFRNWIAADPSVRLPDPPGMVLKSQTCPIDANEQGLKDTIRVGPMTVTRIVVKFGPHTGRYIYHCHILEHEDMEMMRPYLILPRGLDLMGTNFGTGPTSIGPAAAAVPAAVARGHRMGRPAARKTTGRHPG